VPLDQFVSRLSRPPGRQPAVSNRTRFGSSKEHGFAAGKNSASGDDLPFSNESAVAERLPPSDTSGEPSHAARTRSSPAAQLAPPENAASQSLTAPRSSRPSQLGAAKTPPLTIGRKEGRGCSFGAGDGLASRLSIAVDKFVVCRLRQHRRDEAVWCQEPSGLIQSCKPLTGGSVITCG